VSGEVEGARVSGKWKAQEFLGKWNVRAVRVISSFCLYMFVARIKLVSCCLRRSQGRGF